MPPLPAATPEPEVPAPPVEPTATAPVSQGQTRPAVLPSSAWRASSHVSAFVLLLAVRAAMV
uniref:Uncharacterized protein n=1 Tax=Arundo donax TaxID=35708 RepID=A0A0A8Y430_ARUDO